MSSDAMREFLEIVCTGFSPTSRCRPPESDALDVRCEAQAHRTIER